MRMRQRSCCEYLEPRRLLSVGGSYTAPADPTVAVGEDSGWKFALNPAGSPQSTSFSDASWAGVTLPHTWDNTVTTNPATGNGWYRKTITIPASMAGDDLYLQFEGASLSASVYVDGTLVGSHSGGWEAFDINATAQLTTGNHLVAVDVNNNTNSNVLPAGGGDYTKQGGLYRDVSLIAVNPVHVAINQPAPSADASGNDLAGSGVYFSNGTVSMGTASASIAVQTVVDNKGSASEPITVTSYLVDAGGIIRAQMSSTQTLAGGQTDVTVTQNATVANPHLWDGRIDPYLYDLYVQVSNANTGQLLDLNHQQVGIRSFTITADNGFYLNGQSYQLVGVNLHQDTGEAGVNGGPAGWAETDAEQQQDLNDVLAIGATMVRTSHYTRDPAFYAYCDKMGLIVETEVGVNDNVTTTTVNGSTVVSPAFLNASEDALTEMIRQNYNHPSIIIWSLYNEISSNSVNAGFVQTMSNLAHSLDTTGRYTAGETHTGAATDGINADPDVIGWHPYDGWYGSSPGNIPAELSADHKAEPNQPMAVDEFGAGGSAFQYTNSVQIPPASTTTAYHPENQQTEIEEEQYAEISSQKYLYANLLWTMFDFTSSSRDEGDTAGINDKGLITRDRQTYKDAYYFYEANWNSPTSSRGYATTPVVYISDHDWTQRNSATVTVTVFSNLGAPTLSLNGGAAIATTQQVLNGITIPDAYTATLTLRSGSNSIVASAATGGKSSSNSVTWTYTPPATPGSGQIKINFQPADSGPTASGYLIDTGLPFGSRGNGQTYGWSANDSANAIRRNVDSDPRYDTLIQMENGGTYSWSDQLANGTYTVYIAAGDPSATTSVENLDVNGTELFDPAGLTHSAAFTIDVTVTNGMLTISPGAGAINAKLQFVEITPIGSAPTGGNISGTVTANGAGVAGETVYLDANNDSKLDNGELSTTTTSTGAYSFANVPAGAYIIRQELPTGYAQTSPADGYGIHVSVASGQSLTNQNFTDTPPATGGSISGTVTNSSGAGVSGMTIYLDANNDSKLDNNELSTVTNSSGGYSFGDVPPGAYIVRQVLLSGDSQISPADGYGIHLTVANGSSFTKQNFTDSVGTASISGTVFNDSNGDGKQDDGEAGLSGWTVYIDVDNAGSYVAGDPTATTDSSGDYLFSDLPAGTYIVRVERPSGYTQTTPSNNYGQHVTLTSGQKASGASFGEMA